MGSPASVSVGPPAAVAPALAAVLDAGQAGASARAEYERRRDRREQRTRERWGKLGAVAVALSSEPAHERAWARGAEGEELLAARLERDCTEHGVLLLHDRRVPGSRANIDHIAIGPSGITILDAKRYKGMVKVERRGGLMGPRREQLTVDGRPRSKLVDGIRGQVEVVQRVLAGQSIDAVPVRAILCFVRAEMPVFGTLAIGEVEICGPRRAGKLVRAEGPFSAERVRELAAVLAGELAPA